MERVFYRQDQAAVEAALRKGERPSMATTISRTWLDELVALHDSLGVFNALDELQVQRQRAGVNDALLLRTLAVLPFLEHPSLATAAGMLFGEPAVLLRLGWNAEQIAWGDNFRHGGEGDLRQASSLPCHVDTLRDELRRVAATEWDSLQRTITRNYFARGLVRGRTFAIDGSGLGPGLRMVSLVCVSSERPLIVAWRLLTGDASEKGKEAAVTRSLIEQAIEAGGAGCIELLLVDALYADGPLLAWSKYSQNIEVIVPIPADRNMHADLLGLAEAGLMPMKRHSYIATLQGHKQRRELEIGSQDGLTSWDSFITAANEYGAREPCLFGALIRETQPNEKGEFLCWSLVSTRRWSDGFAMYQAYRPRWHIENDAFRELKEGWQLEAQRWGRDIAVQYGRVTLTCLAFNTMQIELSPQGKRLATRGLRSLQCTFRRQLGHSPVVIYLGLLFAIWPVEQLLTILGQSPMLSLLPFGGQPP
jgi:hypothetical protein